MTSLSGFRISISVPTTAAPLLLVSAILLILETFPSYSLLAMVTFASCPRAILSRSYLVTEILTITSSVLSSLRSFSPTAALLPSTAFTSVTTPSNSATTPLSAFSRLSSEPADSISFVWFSASSSSLAPAVIFPASAELFWDFISERYSW